MSGLGLTCDLSMPWGVVVLVVRMWVRVPDRFRLWVPVRLWVPIPIRYRVTIMVPIRLWVPINGYGYGTVMGTGNLTVVGTDTFLGPDVGTDVFVGTGYGYRLWVPIR
jgi:hypothetical protein